VFCNLTANISEATALWRFKNMHIYLFIYLFIYNRDVTNVCYFIRFRLKHKKTKSKHSSYVGGEFVCKFVLKQLFLFQHT